MRHLVAVLRKYSALMIIMEKVESACSVSIHNIERHVRRARRKKSSLIKSAFKCLFLGAPVLIPQECGCLLVYARSIPRIHQSTSQLSSISRTPFSCVHTVSLGF